MDLEAQENNLAWNEWLVVDRIDAIRTVITSPHRPIIFKGSYDPLRDLVLRDLLIKSEVYRESESFNSPVVVSAIPANDKEKNNPVCVEKDKHNAVINFYPLKVCSEEWIYWYANNYLSIDKI